MREPTIWDLLDQKMNTPKWPTMTDLEAAIARGRQLEGENANLRGDLSLAKERTDLLEADLAQARAENDKLRIGLRGLHRDWCDVENEGCDCGVNRLLNDVYAPVDDSAAKRRAGREGV